MILCIRRHVRTVSEESNPISKGRIADWECLGGQFRMIRLSFFIRRRLLIDYFMIEGLASTRNWTMNRMYGDVART
jgi:hypothetical protein